VTGTLGRGFSVAMAEGFSIARATISTSVTYCRSSNPVSFALCLILALGDVTKRRIEVVASMKGELVSSDGIIT